MLVNPYGPILKFQLRSLRLIQIFGGFCKNFGVQVPDQPAFQTDMVCNT